MPEVRPSAGAGRVSARKPSRTRENRRAAGLCMECAVAVSGQSRCDACNAKIRARRQAKRAAGKCTHCLKRNAEPGRKTCEKCRRERAWRYQARKYAGLCARSGCKRKPKPGRTLCQRCMDDTSRKGSDRQRANRKAGRCKCGREAEPGKRNCRPCLDSHRKATMAMHARREADGLCPLCGMRPPGNGLKHCFPCLWRISTAKLMRDERRLPVPPGGEWAWYGEPEAPASIRGDPVP